MKTCTLALSATLTAAALFLGGCDSSKPSGTAGPTPPKTRPLTTDPSIFPLEAGPYTVLGIQLDGGDFNRSRQLAEDTINKHPDIACMVGLWTYNPPQIINAARAAGKLNQIKIVAFDEDPDTLDGIASGIVHSTVAQNPFVFGFKSIEYLAAISRGQEVDVPDDKILYIPVTQVKKDNVAEFRARIDSIEAGTATPPEPDRDYDTAKRLRIAYVTNTVAHFWELAEQGAHAAAPAFNVEAVVLHPPGGMLDEQIRMTNEQVNKGLDGIAISPIDPANQGAFLNGLAEKMPLICQDSDAPDSNRLFYLGTDNYAAGRLVGQHIKEAIPNGGKIMIFVGKMEVLNAQERSQGIIDVLLDLPDPRN